MHRSTRWLLAEIGFLLAAATLLGALNYPFLLPYLGYVFLHILGVILFIGNIIVTGVWVFLAERSKEPSVMRHAAEVANWADVFFTAPGIILITLNGLTLAQAWGGVFGASWIVTASALFAASGIVWGAFLVRYQDKLIRLSRDLRGGPLPQEFFGVLHKWYIWGAIATILPLISAAIMILKV